MGHRVSSLLLRAVETLIFCYVSLEFAVTSALVSSLNVVGEELSFAVVVQVAHCLLSTVLR